MIPATVLSANGMEKVIYESKDDQITKTFNALDWPSRYE